MLICNDYPPLPFPVFCSRRLIHGGEVTMLPQSSLDLCSLAIITPPFHSQRCYPTTDIGTLFLSYSTCAVPLTSLCNSRYDTARRGRGESHGRIDWLPNGHGWTGPSPPVMPVRAQSNCAKFTAHSPSYDMRDAPLPSSAFSMPLRISDQFPSAHKCSLTPSLELAGSDCNVHETSPSPSRVNKTSGRCPTRHDGVPEVASLHPDPVVTTCRESRLSNSGNRISNGFSFAC